MSYRWKKTVEAIQLPGDVPAGLDEGEGWNAKKGEWLIFENGLYICTLNDKEFHDRLEDATIPKKPKKHRRTLYKPPFSSSVRIGDTEVYAVASPPQNGE